MTILGQPLKDIFLAQCFRRGDEFDAYRTSISKCLTTSVEYYTGILIKVAAIVAFCFILKAGYTMFTAFGDEAKYAAGKKTLQFAIIGFIISVSAGLIIYFFAKVLGYTKPV